jgi:surface antigen
MRNTLVAIVAMAAILVGAAVSPAAMAQPYDDGPYSEPPYDDDPYADDGYAPPPPPPPRNYRYRGCSRDRTAGTIIGGILGGILGNNLGRGRNRGAATVAGIIFGGIAGNAIARGACRDRQADAYYYNEAYYDAFERPRYGQRYNWRNPYSRNYGYVVPTSDYDDGHRYGYRGSECREFEQAIWIDGHRTQAYGTACRARDGSWRIVRY